MGSDDLRMRRSPGKTPLDLLGDYDRLAIDAEDIRIRRRVNGLLLQHGGRRHMMPSTSNITSRILRRAGLSHLIHLHHIRTEFARNFKHTW